MRIYISATYSDLIEHRAAVARVLRQMGHDVISMEEYVAEGTRPLDRCLADAAGADVCVSIIAWRYGYVPAETSTGSAIWPQGAKPGTTSITECEFLAAVPKRPLVFLLDPAASCPAPFMDAVTGENESGARIKRFRDELFSNWLAGIFRTPEDLARQVSASIYRREISNRTSMVSLALESGFSEAVMVGGPVQDSTLMSMKQSLANSPQLAVLRIDLRDEPYWWSTRLFFLACVVDEVAATDLLIFLQSGDRFVGAATPATVLDRLARSSPLLHEFDQNCRKSPVDKSNIDDALDQRAAEWNTLFSAQSEEQVRILASPREVRRWFATDLLRRGVEQDPASPASPFLKGVPDWPHSCVPITSNGKLVRVVSRVALMEQLARMFVQDLDRSWGLR
ncbi:hypothetical protein B5V01_08165 [Mesorhizobium erdmanii]|uniref:DUF4062 domain-containing protein n=2 Tax=Mesorhizobium TaxID=68287 RepID=A0A3M9X3G8_9HYPH|nr:MULTISPECIES: DUF4062 domain-containing protein [Mesorhizobium]RNJ42391.1 hypothetical protein DNR46_28760 [Mesorhizobium japonicum]RXT47927.1 hypothetical protein B5V01_08165 [Mesorhizobium erdmanii]